MRRKQKLSKVNDEKVDRLPRQPQVTVATRTWVLIELMGRAANRMAGQPVNEEKVSVPDWVRRGCERLAEMQSGPFIDELKQCGDGRSLRRLGLISGLYLRFGSFLKQDAPRMLASLPDIELSSEQEDALEAEIGLAEIKAPLESLLGFRLETEDDWVQAGQQIHTRWMERLNGICGAAVQVAGSQSAGEQKEFIAGTEIGHRVMLNEVGQCVGDRGRGSLYRNLLAWWPEIEAFKSIKPARSRRQLFEALTAELGPDEVGRDERRFLEVCDDLGLKMKGVGRPRMTRPGN